MGYVVINGEVHDGSNVYVVGDHVPAMKGSLSDMVAVGAIEWRSEPKPKSTPTPAAKLRLRRVK